MRTRGKPSNDSAKTRLNRALSKLGFCSRNQAYEIIRAGRVSVNGAVSRDAERSVDLNRDRIEVDGKKIEAERKIYLMLNKPRGLVTTASDERGRKTVFECLAKNPDLPRVFPVGRLDQASEGLLLFTNDTAWAAKITDPKTHLDKIYHVQVNCLADEALARKLECGVNVDGELLTAKHVSILRLGEKNSWLEIILDEGKNRHIRRLLDALGISVLQLVRVRIGPLPLGNLAKGEFRFLTSEEVRLLMIFFSREDREGDDGGFDSHISRRVPSRRSRDTNSRHNL
jgi:23S rRNA pseudouridine2605 synthase